MISCSIKDFYIPYPFGDLDDLLTTWHAIGEGRDALFTHLERGLGSAWPGDREVRLEMLSPEGGAQEVARQLIAWESSIYRRVDFLTHPDDIRLVELNWNNGQLISWVYPHTFVETLAECEMRVAADPNTDPLKEWQLLCDAKAHITWAKRVRRELEHGVGRELAHGELRKLSELEEEIDRYIRDFSTIRNIAYLLHQGTSSRENRALPDNADLLITIAALSGNPAVHSKKESEKIAREYFRRPRVNPAEQVIPSGIPSFK